MLQEVYLDYSDKKRMLVVAKAIANEARISILELLNEQSLSVNEIAEQLGLPASTAALNIRILENAGLLFTESQPGIRGSMKISSRVCDRVILQLSLDNAINKKENSVEVTMPIGNFMDCEISPTCGLASEYSPIGVFDQPSSFYFPKRTLAQALWFYKGYVEYRFPNNVNSMGIIKQLHLSFEACSEAPFYRNDWPSDVTVWINGVEIGTWTSPGDFGGRRGKLNPSWWSDTINQYGELKNWRVNSNGTYLDSFLVSPVCIDDLHVDKDHFITLRIGIKEDAENVGGVTLFGEHFGDYPQDIILKLDYDVV